MATRAYVHYFGPNVSCSIYSPCYVAFHRPFTDGNLGSVKNKQRGRGGDCTSAGKAGIAVTIASYNLYVFDPNITASGTRIGAKY